MINNYFIILPLIYGADRLSLVTTNYINKENNVKIDANTRWFFIHSVCNFIITIAAIPDLYYLILNPDKALVTKWNYGSYFVFNLSLGIHIYHTIFFKLRIDDIIHHFLMCLIAGYLEYQRKTIISSSALFFLTGLPGGIDFFLLYLVKLNKLSKIKEKEINTFLNTWIRSPGCTYIAYVGFYNIKTDYYNNHNLWDSFCSLLSCTLTFWNGQYYMYSTCKNYGKYIMMESDKTKQSE